MIFICKKCFNKMGGEKKKKVNILDFLHQSHKHTMTPMHKQKCTRARSQLSALEQRGNPHHEPAASA